MSASSIFFNGRLISIPGSYSEVDASGLESLGLGSSGIVAALGMSIGGKPWTAVDESDTKGNMQVSTRPSSGKGFFRSGDLLEAQAFLFGPASDADVPGGAQEVVNVKVNPAAKSTATFNNTDGAALVLNSADWGFFTTQINVQIATGTTKGKLITIVFEDTTETFDNVGGDSIFTLVYLASTPANGFTTITGEITASRVKTLFTRTNLGLDTDVTNQVTAGQVIENVSSSAADVGVKIRIFGTSAANATQSEVVTLNGTTPVDTVGLWNEFHGVQVIEGVLAGTLTVRNDGAGLTITTIAPAGVTKAIKLVVDHAIAGVAVTVAADAATTRRVTIFGLSNAGVFQTEVFVLAGATPVAGVALWSRIDGLALGRLEAARTLTVSGTSVDAVFTGLPTIQKLADKFNGTPGYDFLVVVANPTTFASTDLDTLAAASILSPALITARANLAAIIAKLNAESQLVVASKGSPGTGAPTNTTAPVFLTGGHEGSAVAGQEGVPTATFTDWQGAIDLLTKVRVNTLVALTGDPAVHAAVKAHCQFMGGVGRSERDAVIGAMNAALTNVPTKTEYKTKAVDLNTRHIRLVGQAMERFDSLGVRREFLPPFTACIIAGAQAGSAVGASLTRKFMNVLKLRNHSTWNPVDDAEEMIQAGLCFMEVVDGVGRRVVRNVTTHLTSSNLAFTEGGVNQAVNFAVFNFRTTMETMVGKTGFQGTRNAAMGVAQGVLNSLVNIAITTFRSLDIELILDVLEVSVEISPVLPVNFVKSTVHLVTVPQSAAA
jgi:hypothetical protein